MTSEQRTPPIVNRGKRHVYVGCFAVSAILLYVNFWWASTVQQMAILIALPNAVLIATQFVWRLCLLAEECKHLNKLCSGSYSRLLERTFWFNTISLTTTLATIAIVFTNEQNLSDTWRAFGPVPFCLSYMACFILHCIMRSEVCPAYEAHTMKEFNGLDYGSGMAHSFYHGYLKLILPARGDNVEGISERIVKFIEKASIEEHEFPIQKLIVYIPSSGRVFPLLSDEPTQVGTDPDVTHAEALEDHLRNRAGTKGRVYRGGAYRIRVRKNGKPSFLYTIAEGATAVLSCYEACSAGSPEAEHLRKHRADVISNFYQTLQKLIDDDKEISHLVELLYYDDEDGVKVDVLDLLTQHLLEARFKKYNC